MSKSKKFFNNPYHQIVAIIALIITSIFAIWWFQISHIPNNFQGFWHIFDIVLFLIVSYIIWHPIIMTGFNWLVASHIIDRKSSKPQKGLKVAFLTTFVPDSESIDLLHQCLPAMVKADYPHDTWLLDEGNSKEAQEICKQYGVKYFTRNGLDHYNQESGKFKAKTKGGNHNAWHDSHGHNYDIIAQLDTDFVPKRNFLMQTLGYFNDPKVGFVVTPQIYGNIEESFISYASAQQQYNFYGPILRGLDGMKMNTLIGANHLIRVKALSEIDHYTAHITEDLVTGMELHARGWDSVYVPKVLAIGQGPTTWKAYFNQQMRWAYGCIDILFKYSFNLFKSMSLRQKIYYFILQQHYFSGTAMILGVFGLIAYFFAGIDIAKIELIPFLIFYLPIIGILGLMSFWLQQFNIRPKIERGMLWSGMAISIASWPIFFLAFINIIRGKKLSYKVTPKGIDKQKGENSLALFTPHFIIATIALIALISVFFTGRDSIILVFWAIITLVTMALIPFSQYIFNTIVKSKKMYNIFDYDSRVKNLTPDIVSDKEKHTYLNLQYPLIIWGSLISFTLVMISLISFISENPILWILIPFIILTIVYYIVSFFVNLKSKEFDLDKHHIIVSDWKPPVLPSIDIFLPICGENIDILKNTWGGVQDIQSNYKGEITVYVLDDGDNKEAKKLAQEHNFTYIVRPNRGEYKKAGNLRHAFSISKGDFIAIFDADFRPRKDFLHELLPYMYKDSSLGIIQSPQYFNVSHKQNWLERGAGATQELFYRFTQSIRDNHKSAICVGSNAVYRRSALNDIGGTTLIEHSEDVHTGFDLRVAGWDLMYIPIVLAKGVSPETMTAFFNQQYRWCMGSMSLMKSSKFWKLKLSLPAKLSYISGFLYYIHTAINSVVTPIIPLFILLVTPDTMKLKYTLILLPAFIFTWVIYPLWHKNTFGIEVWTVQHIYGWAHLIAIVNLITKSQMAWIPTGSKSNKNTNPRYTVFRSLQILLNFIPSIIWVIIAGYYTFVNGEIEFGLLFITGLLYLSIVSRVSFYKEKNLNPEENTQNRLGSIFLTFRYLFTPSILAICFIFIYVNIFTVYSSGTVVNSNLGIKPINFMDRVATTNEPKPEEPKSEPKPPAVEDKPNNYTYAAEAGEGVTQLARRAIMAYTDENNITLSAEQKVFIETTLKNKYYKKVLEINESIAFESSVISDTINQAQNLTPGQINAWGRYI